MKRIVLIPLALLFFPFIILSQKNVTIVTNSKITGISLPEGSKEDKRILPVAGAKTLLELTATEMGRVLSGEPEVLSLPPSFEPGSAQILKKLAAAGFTIEEKQDFPSYYILKKSEKELLAYLSDSKTSTEFYICQLETPPALTGNIPEKQENNSQSGLIPSAKTKEELSSNTQIPEKVTTTQVRSGFTFTITNFNDGWTSSSGSDFILVKKSDLAVRLYFPSEISENMRPPVTEITDYFWNLIVLPEFTIVSSWRYEQPVSFFSTYYMYAEAVEKSTGRSAFIGLNVETNTGIAYPVLAIAADRASYEKQFPEPKSVSNMLGYNRFAVALPDLAGKWTESSGSAMNYYNSISGAYAGMAIAQSSNEFIFKADGTYSSRHSGATGMVGTIQTFDQKYAGQAKVSEWELVLTNRFNGATDTFEAWFEEVKGGRILKLVNKEATGIRYNLVKVSGE